MVRVFVSRQRFVGGSDGQRVPPLTHEPVRVESVHPDELVDPEAVDVSDGGRGRLVVGAEGIPGRDRLGVVLAVEPILGLVEHRDANLTLERPVQELVIVA